MMRGSLPDQESRTRIVIDLTGSDPPAGTLEVHRGCIPASRSAHGGLPQRFTGWMDMLAQLTEAVNPPEGDDP